LDHRFGLDADGAERQAAIAELEHLDNIAQYVIIRLH
jgi:hypothetical protein